MGYAAARGGLAAIRAAESLVQRLREQASTTTPADIQLIEHFGALVDRVMGEGGVWGPEMAAAALRQGGGDPIEAAHLIRSKRSTLAVIAVARADADEIQVLRRIVPAYRTPPGAQILGATTDYAGRILDTSSPPQPAESHVAYPPQQTAVLESGDRTPQRLLSVLRDLDLVVDRRRDDDPEPFDITQVAARPPAPRSARLSAMARAETGALVNVWYRNILGPDGYLHEITLGEVRHGHIPVRIDHPHTGRSITVCRVRVTEVEAIEDLDGVDEDRTRVDVGYGFCFGHNEKKAIAMANLDIACHRDNGRTQLEQSLLLTTDGLESTGFLEHLKLPHYVTFRSIIERKMAARRRP